jgi:uncharacterized membrane protein
MNSIERIFLLDFFRGCAVCGMVLFHFFWDINFFSIIPIALYSGFIGVFQQLVLFSFVFISGFSLLRTLLGMVCLYSNFVLQIQISLILFLFLASIR